MSKRKFKPGDRVVCINNSNTPYFSDTAHPEVGKIYTVRKYGPCSSSGLGILLVEIVNPVEPSLLGPSEATFHQDRFVKIDENFDKEAEKEVKTEKKVKVAPKVLEELKEKELVLEN